MDQEKPFVIVVDDDDDDRYLLNSCFVENGLNENVKFFGDALQFIRYTELIASLNVKPSLIILDYKMPYMNGKAVVNYLKASTVFKEIPVVIFSNSLTSDVEEKLLQLGVTRCYQKGMDYVSLCNDLREILKIALPVTHK